MQIRNDISVYRSVKFTAEMARKESFLKQETTAACRREKRERNQYSATERIPPTS